MRYHNAQSSLVSLARINLAEHDLANGADFILWLDGDQTFPADTLSRLLAHEKPIVGCNIADRWGRSATTATGLDGANLGAGQGLAEVAAIGFGVILTARQAFDQIERPWFAFEATSKTLLREDYYFSRKVRQEGLSVYCDHDLSREIGHIGEKVYML